MPLCTRRFQLPVSLGVNLSLPARKRVQGSHKTDGAVQPHLVVVIDVLLDQTASIVWAERRSRPDAFAFQRFVPVLQFAVGLRIVRGGPHVRDARDADELLEVLGKKLRPVVGNNPRPGIRILLLGPLQNDLHVGLSHRFTQIPVHDEAACLSILTTARLAPAPATRWTGSPPPRLDPAS